VDAIDKQLPSRNKVSLALDRWISTNKLAITSVIAYNWDPTWALCVVHLTFDMINGLTCSNFESELRTIGQGSIDWSNASHTFERSSQFFYAYHWPVTWNNG
jgi:hypothetical protein